MTLALNLERKAEAFGKEHESAGKGVVEIAVACPEEAVLDVLGAIGGLAAVDVLENLVEQVADDDAACKGRVRGTFEGILE